MAFRFPLKALWRVRAIYEKRERQRLEVITRHLIQMQKQLVDLRQDRLEQAGSLANSLKKGMTGAELQFDALCLAARQKRIAAAAQAVEDLSRQHKKQLMKYRQARQKVEIMERLHERQLSAYRRIQARFDQQQATDLFLIRSHPVNDG
jgi:flagellar export protein FliJ